MTLAQITIEGLALLQACVFPLGVALWWSVTNRITRLEKKIDLQPSVEVCVLRHKTLDDRLVKLEVT